MTILLPLPYLLFLGRTIPSAAREQQGFTLKLSSVLRFGSVRLGGYYLLSSGAGSGEVYFLGEDDGTPRET